MPCFDFITILLRLPADCREISTDEVFQFHLPKKHHDCPHCGCAHTHVDKYRVQELRGLSDKGPAIRYRNRRYRCTACGRTFSEERGFLGRYQRMPASIIGSMVEDHGELVTTSSIARRYGVSPSTVARHFQKTMERMEEGNGEGRDAAKAGAADPKPSLVLSMDEFRGNVKSKFQVAIHDLESRTCLDILPDRGKGAIEESLASIPQEARSRVETISIDLSPHFRSLVWTYFENAVIAADKFHAIRLAHNALDAVRIATQEKIKDAGAKARFKNARKLLHANPANLTESGTEKLKTLLAISEDLAKAYALKEEYHKLFDNTDRKAFMQALDAFAAHAGESGIRAFRSVVRTTYEWKEEIWHGIATGYNNGFTEGCNNTIKVLKRIAYGFRNFQNFRRRILYILNNPKRRERRSKKCDSNRA